MSQRPPSSRGGESAGYCDFLCKAGIGYRVAVAAVCRLYRPPLQCSLPSRSIFLQPVRIQKSDRRPCSQGRATGESVPEIDGLYRPLHVMGQNISIPGEGVRTNEGFTVLTWEFPESAAFIYTPALTAFTAALAALPSGRRPCHRRQKQKAP